MLKKFTLHNFFLSLTILTFFTTNLQAQNGCPGCLVDVPGNLAIDTLFLDEVPDGIANNAYDEDVSFRLPKTTTPVAANDPSVSPGITLNEIKVLYITNLPPGMEWETNEDIYYPDNETDGCVRFCGTPLAPGYYVMDVVLEVKVLFVTQETSFPIEMEVLPSVTSNDGFTMTNSTGCGEVIVDFQNNIPSNGNSGYSYSWNFGNGNTSFDENPSTQIYSSPGTYPVDYQAVIDTSDYILTNVRVMGADCGDFFTPPDLYLDIMDPSGNHTVTASFTDISTPVEFTFNMPLVSGNYTLVVKDEDGGLNGADDVCDYYSFNQLSDGVLLNGGSSIELTILHPVDTITTTDSVYVYPQPDQPQISYDQPLTWCENETILLTSSYSTSNQWFMNGNEIIGATDQTWLVQESGIYSVEYTNEFGCVAVAEEVAINLVELPKTPIYNNSDNLLELVVPGILPNDYTLQWYYENTLLPGENGLSYCLTQSGNVTLEVTDNETGCINSFSNDHIFNPEYECGVLGIEEIVESTFNIYPNPFNGLVNIEFTLEEASNCSIQVFDLLGKKVFEDTHTFIIGNFAKTYNFGNWNEGVYLLVIDFGSFRIQKRIVLQK